MTKKKLSAKEVVTDIRAGMPDDQLMGKYGLSAAGLKSLMSKLLNAGMMTQAELSNRDKAASSGRSTPPKLPIDKIILDLNAGLSDDQMVQKYGIPAAKLPKLYEKLVDGGYITKKQLDQRNLHVDGTVDLTPSVFPEAPVQSSEGQQSSHPIFKFLCPKCKTPHEEEYAVCPQCGVIIDKYKARLKPEKEPETPEPLQNMDQKVGASIQVRSGALPQNEEVHSAGGALPVFKNDPFIVLVLSILTCGLYLVYWNLKTTEVLNAACSKQLMSPPVAAFSGCCVPLNVYFYYVCGQALVTIGRIIGKEEELKGKSNLLLILGIFFPMLAAMIVQGHINELYE